MSLNQKDMFRSNVPETDDPVYCVYFVISCYYRKPKRRNLNQTEYIFYFDHPYLFFVKPQRPNLPVVNRAVRIQEAHLPRLNKRLSSHLQKMGVEPQIYMMYCFLIANVSITPA